MARDISTNSASLPFVEALYAAFRADPSSVTPDWRAYFAALDEELGAAPGPNG
ncbi:hypothetical protein KDL67_17245, partial [bacterium]|nr:hypothetical protein [bacterium]